MMERMSSSSLSFFLICLSADLEVLKAVRKIFFHFL